LAEHISSPTPGAMPGGGYSTTPSHASPGAGTRIVDRVKERATAQLSTQKDRATDGLGSVAQAVRQTTQGLRDHHHDTVARYAEQAADQIERFSERLKHKNVTELLDDAQRLARRQPALFVGGAFAIGLLGARFLKSSSPSDGGQFNDRNRNYGWSDATPSAYGRPGSAYGTPATSATRGTAASGESSFGTTGNRDDRERF
jgi:hypothetical protein